MTQPRIEHADVSEYIQMAISAAKDLELTRGQAVIWEHQGLESAANAAVSAVDDVLIELRRLAKETT